MSANRLIVRSGVLHGFHEFMQRRGVDLGPILASAGIDPSTIVEPFGEIPLASFAAVMEAAAQKSGDPCLGLEWADAFPAGGTGLFGYLVLNAATLRDALRNWERYASLLTHPVEAKFEEDTHGAVVVWHWPTSMAAEHAQSSSFFAGLMISRFRRASRESWDPELVELAHRPMGCDETARRIFRCKVVYNATRNAVYLDTSVLDRRFASADSQLLSIVKLLGDHMLTDLKASGHILDETRLAIFENLEKGKVTLELISERLGLSPRGLQSRLKEAGKPFYVLLSETRATAATRYLRDTDLPLVEIAYLLGFSEQSAFTRAAQRWYDELPSVMRQKLRGERSAA